jgi:hypothetical protein
MSKFAQMQALEQPKPAPIQELHHQVVRRRQLRQNRSDFFTGKHHRDVRFSFCSDSTFQLSKLFVQDMAIEKQQGIERLVLSGSGHLLIYRQKRKEPIDLLRSQ